MLKNAHSIIPDSSFLTKTCIFCTFGHSCIVRWMCSHIRRMDLVVFLRSPPLRFLAKRRRFVRRYPPSIGSKRTCVHELQLHRSCEVSVERRVRVRLAGPFRRRVLLTALLSRLITPLCPERVWGATLLKPSSGVPKTTVLRSAVVGSGGD